MEEDIEKHLSLSVDFDERKGRVRIKEKGVEIGQLQLAFTESNNAVIVDVGVPKEHRRKGLGKRLTEEAEKIARQKGAGQIGAIAQPDYLELLKDMGYEQDGFFATKELSSKK